MDGDFKLPCRFSENLGVTAHSSYSALRRDRKLKKQRISRKTWYLSVVQGGMTGNGRWRLVRRGGGGNKRQIIRAVGENHREYRNRRGSLSNVPPNIIQPPNRYAGRT